LNVKRIKFPDVLAATVNNIVNEEMKRIRPRDVIIGAFDNCDGEPYVCDYRSMDIPNTIRWLIRNAPEGLVAVSLRPYGADMIKIAEREARKRNARIIWVPLGKAIIDQAEQIVKEEAAAL